MVLSDPERAYEILEQANLPFTESDLLVVTLPDGQQPLLQICKALLQAEISIHYAYPLLIGPRGRSAVALHVEDHETAVNVLAQLGFTLFTENDLDTDEDLTWAVAAFAKKDSHLGGRCAVAGNRKTSWC